MSRTQRTPLWQERAAEMLAGTLWEWEEYLRQAGSRQAGSCVWPGVSRIRPEALGTAELAKCFLGKRGTLSLTLHAQVNSQAPVYTYSPQLGTQGQLNLSGQPG